MSLSGHMFDLMPGAILKKGRFDTVAVNRTAWSPDVKSILAALRVSCRRPSGFVHQPGVPEERTRSCITLLDVLAVCLLGAMLVVQVALLVALLVAFRGTHCALAWPLRRRGDRRPPEFRQPGCPGVLGSTLVDRASQRVQRGRFTHTHTHNSSQAKPHAASVVDCLTNKLGNAECKACQRSADCTLRAFFSFAVVGPYRTKFWPFNCTCGFRISARRTMEIATTSRCDRSVEGENGGFGPAPHENRGFGPARLWSMMPSRSSCCFTFRGFVAVESMTAGAP